MGALNPFFCEKTQKLLSGHCFSFPLANFHSFNCFPHVQGVLRQKYAPEKRSGILCLFSTYKRTTICARNSVFDLLGRWLAQLFQQSSENVLEHSKKTLNSRNRIVGVKTGDLEAWAARPFRLLSTGRSLLCVTVHCLALNQWWVTYPRKGKTSFPSTKQSENGACSPSLAPPCLLLPSVGVQFHFASYFFVSPFFFFLTFSSLNFVVSKFVDVSKSSFEVF